MLLSLCWAFVAVTSWPGTLAIRETSELWNLDSPFDPVDPYSDGSSQGPELQAELVAHLGTRESASAGHTPTLEGAKSSQAAIQEPHDAATAPGWPLAVAEHVAEIERSVEEDVPRIAEDAKHTLLSELGFIEPCKESELDGRRTGCFAGCSCYFYQNCYPMRDSVGANLGVCSLRISVLTVLSLALLCCTGSCVVGSRLFLQHREYLYEVAWLEKKSAEYVEVKAAARRQEDPIQVDHGWESGTD